MESGERISNTLLLHCLSDIHLGRIRRSCFADRRLRTQSLSREECGDESETWTPYGVAMPTSLHNTGNNWGASPWKRHAVIIFGDLQHYLTGERETGRERERERKEGRERERERGMVEKREGAKEINDLRF